MAKKTLYVGKIGNHTMKRLCCIFNFGPHYRKAIYTLMDRELGCDFFIGDNAPDKIKRMDYSSLGGFKSELEYRHTHISTFWYLKGASAAFFNRQYNTFITTGDSSNLTSWMMLLCGKILSKKVILWGHGWKRTNNWKGNLLDSMYWRLASHNLVFSHYAMDYMEEKGVSRSKMSCIYNSLDYDQQLKIRHSVRRTAIYQDHFGNGNPTLLYIGRLQKRKKISMVLDAMLLLKAEGIDTNFVCIGGEDEGLGLERAAAERGLTESVWLYGPLYDEEKKAELIYNAYVCVSPGNVGLTAIDALNYGLPVITNDCYKTQMPEFEAITPEETGSFFKDGSVASLAGKIKEWIGVRNTCEWDETTRKCHKVVDEKYNPHNQIGIIKEALARLA